MSEPVKQYSANWVTRYYTRIVKGFEQLLALGVLAGVIAHAIASVFVLAGMDWRTTETFYELVYRALLLVIGLEFIRMLIIHDLTAILELLAFVIARKMLKPDIVALDIVLGVMAFVALLAARRYLLIGSASLTQTEGDDDKRNIRSGTQESQ